MQNAFALPLISSKTQNWKPPPLLQKNMSSKLNANKWRCIASESSNSQLAKVDNAVVLTQGKPGYVSSTNAVERCEALLFFQKAGRTLLPHPWNLRIAAFILFSRFRFDTRLCCTWFNSKRNTGDILLSDTTGAVIETVEFSICSLPEWADKWATEMRYERPKDTQWMFCYTSRRIYHRCLIAAPCQHSSSTTRKFAWAHSDMKTYTVIMFIVCLVYWAARYGHFYFRFWFLWFMVQSSSWLFNLSVSLVRFCHLYCEMHYLFRFPFACIRVCACARVCMNLCVYVGTSISLFT